MTRPVYDVKEEYIGDGLLSVYTFDFKIEAKSQLTVIELDDTVPVPVETRRVDGDDVTYLSSVIFNSVDGGGTVTLAAALPANYELIFLLANDEPTQPYEFKNKGSFTLSRLGAALDFAVGAIQRLAYRGKQALRIHDTDDEETFDAQFPPGVAEADNYGRFLKIKDDGTGFEFGITLGELQDAVLPAGTIVGQVLTWSGAAWVEQLQGGGLYVSTTQDIPANGDIVLNAAIQQILKVQGALGSQTANIATFASIPSNGTLITLLGVSNTNVLKIPYSDTVGGCMIKGDCYLGLNDTLTLVYDSALQRYLELSRN